MQKLMVKDIMVPLERYATIHEDHLLIDAIESLEKAQNAFEESPYVHRAVLVYDDNKKIVGKLSQWDVIKCLEPKYESFGDLRSTSLSGLSPELIKSMMEKYGLWRVDMDDICGSVARKKVKDVMYLRKEKKLKRMLRWVRPCIVLLSAIISLFLLQKTRRSSAS
jgi:Mg2+/Co2+ transporter CorB